MEIRRYSGCRPHCARVTGYPVRHGNDLYLVYLHSQTGWTFFAVDPESLRAVVETNFDQVTATPEALAEFIARVCGRVAWSRGCEGCPVEEMFCEEDAPREEDCRDKIRRWLRKPVNRGGCS